MRGSQTDQKITRILLLLDNLLMIHQSFDVNLPFKRCMFITGGAFTAFRYCTSITTDLVAMLYGDIDLFSDLLL